MLRETQTAKAAEPLNGRATSGNVPAQADDPAFDALQGILFGEYRERIGELRGQLERLRGALTELEQEVELLNDVESLAEKIKPSLAPAISASISESREEMVGALY